MNTATTEKSSKLIPGLIWLGCAGMLIAAFRLLTGCRAVMNSLAAAALEVKRAVAWACAWIPLSVGELLACAAIAAALVFIVCTVVSAVKRKERRLRFLAGRALLAADVLATLYLLMCLTLSVTYYADGFSEKSGITPRGGTVQELYSLMEEFTEVVNQYSVNADREADRSEILDRSAGLYDGAERIFPFLAGPERRPKPLLLSRLMSRFGYTGYYFPFTGEANVNIDFPKSQLPATVAHELAHQRGVASEDEANFVAVLACLNSGDDLYAYSGALSAWTHLGNALYKQNKEAYFELFSRLEPAAAADLREASEYWQRFESPVTESVQSVYDVFLKSHGETEGIHSYGQVVDLLLAYYK